MVLAYTDSLFESFDSNGDMLRADGIAKIANSISGDSAGDLHLGRHDRDPRPSEQRTCLMERQGSGSVSPAAWAV